MSGTLLDQMEVFQRLRRACEAAGGQAAWAERHDLSPTYVSEVLHAKQEPGPKILAALGLAKVTRFVELRRVNG